MSHEFVKTTWNNGASPAITAEQLNRIEDAIDESISAINDLETGKQDELTFDSTPTANSQNPVTSGGIKQALEAKADLASPAFTGTPKAPTPLRNATDQIATAEFVNRIIEPIEQYTNELSETILPEINDNIDDLEDKANSIESSIAQSESTSTASKNYAVGDLIILNDQLYRVIVPIASGITITPSVNVVSTTIDDELKARDAEIDSLDTRVDALEIDTADLENALSDMQEEIDNFEGISDEVKEALLNCFAHVAWIDTHGADYYEALRLVFYPVLSISAVYTQSEAVDITDSLDSLKTNLVVTATKKDSTQFIVPSSDYELSGTLALGTSTITVTYQQKTTTFDVIVTDRRIVFLLNNGTDMTGRAIDTEVTVFQPDDSFTILIDINLSALASDKTQAFALNHKGLSNGTLRLGFDQDANHIEHFVTNVMYADSYAEEYTPGDVSALTSHNLKWAVRMSNKNVRKVLFVDDRKLLDKSENVSSSMSDKSFTGKYFAGAMSSTTNVSFTVPGIANVFRIYNTALSNAEMASILNVTL